MFTRAEVFGALLEAKSEPSVRLMPSLARLRLGEAVVLPDGSAVRRMPGSFVLAGMARSSTGKLREADVSAELRNRFGEWMSRGVTVTPTRGHLHVASPFDREFVGGVKKIEGRWAARSKVWSVPEARAGELESLLRRVYGPKGASVASSDLPSSVRSVDLPGGGVRVEAPYSEEWRSKAKALSGRWNADAKGWEFPAHRRVDAMASAQRIFSARDEQPKTAKGPKAARVAVRKSGASDRQVAALRRLTRRLERVELFDSINGTGAVFAREIEREMERGLSRRRASELIDSAIFALEDEM